MRLVFGVTLVGGVLAIQALVFGVHSDTPLPGWWVLLNFVPILFGYAADMGLRQSAQAGLYIGLVVQWAVIGILCGDLYLKFVRSRRQG